MFNKYYQDELLFLREMGREFSRANPDAAPFLAEAGSDPDVERLLEGFAFLTGRLRQKLDDELPELTHALLEAFFPHYLRPIPSMAIVQFEPLPQAAKEVRHIARGTPLDSVPVDGTRCRFRTAYDVELAPLKVQAAAIEHSVPAKLKVRFKLADGITFGKLGIDRLRLHLAGENVVSHSLYLCLCRYCERIAVRVDGQAGDGTVLDRSALQPVGFAPEHALLAYPSTSFLGFRVLQEYFSFPAKFMFVDLTGLKNVRALENATAFELVFTLSHLPDNMPPVSDANIQANCTPVVNLFAHDGDPIHIDNLHSEYKIRPEGANPSHREIYSITSVHGLAKSSPQPRPFKPLFHLAHTRGSQGDFFQERRKPSIVYQGTDHYLTLVSGDGKANSDVDTLVLNLICTNRLLPSSLGPGDINALAPDSPAFARFRNLTKPTATVMPPLGDDLPWRLLSHLALNYSTLSDVTSLRSLLEIYNFRALVDRQAQQSHRRLLDGIREVSAKPSTRMLKALPVRGLAIELVLAEENFGSEGDLYLFAAVIDELFSQYVGLNSFTSLAARGVKTGEVHQFAPRLGRRPLL